jgi:hypothetical protein
MRHPVVPIVTFYMIAILSTRLLMNNIGRHPIVCGQLAISAFASSTYWSYLLLVALADEMVANPPAYGRRISMGWAPLSSV